MPNRLSALLISPCLSFLEFRIWAESERERLPQKKELKRGERPCALGSLSSGITLCMSLGLALLVDVPDSFPNLTILSSVWVRPGNFPGKGNRI